ncbi:hypothetical protein SG34_031385 [Thalassomonas viridans]|uniref:Saccharopine dehydrogenase NADP binding domain-containing protein n=1 Tax=Thalassomonas viridans TaxID=137584 RepID=A0AAF0CFM8_9GAMM|nr:hypothetical protein [Thalassomonas viridans]WDE09269.1 hypothetical protein SG34_031385 [Thalassomonas viridans]
MQKNRSIVLIGLGDLAKRIAFSLMSSPAVEFDDLVIISRNKANGESYTRLLSGCGERRVRFCQLDALDTRALAGVLKSVNPQLVIQCASLMSPWLLYESRGQKAKHLLTSGFAAQLPAQLPVPVSVMTALHDAGLDVPVINCSYPDVVNPVLARLGLPVALGIGNSGMIHGLVRAELQKAGTDTTALRVFGHHAHVASVANSELKAGMPAPMAYLHNEAVPVQAALFAQPGIMLNRELNVLTAAHAVEVIGAMTGEDKTLCTSVPGPLGLAGGWPVRICNTAIDLDLPEQVSRAQISGYQEQLAVFDGVGKIDDDGTIHFSDGCRDSLSRLSPGLSEPLAPLQSLQRLTKINELLNNDEP